MENGRAGTDFCVIVPCFNEAECLLEFHQRLSAVMNQLDGDWEVIYVNDGSRDNTLDCLGKLYRADRHVCVLDLSRNFGKEAALTAGLDRANADAVIIIDADLQDPPELISQLVAAWRQGFDVVNAQRRDRAGETWLKLFAARAFYKLFYKIGAQWRVPENVGDFRLLSRRAVDALKQLRETNRFMKGLFAWIGYPNTAVLYDRDRRFSGHSKFSYWSLWNFALDGITGFTAVPLKVSTYVGVASALSAILYALLIFFRTLFLGDPVPGYPSLVVIILFIGGIQLIILGIIGEYLGRVFDETKRRPLYFVKGSMQHGVFENNDPAILEGGHNNQGEVY
jgi:glycosyltransferase involved in cell wall biosynthesis